MTDKLIDAGPFRVEVRGTDLIEVSIRLLNEKGEESHPILWVDNFPPGSGMVQVYLHERGNPDPDVRAVDLHAVFKSSV